MRKHPTSQFSAQKWQREILNNPANLERLLLECCRNPEMCSVLKDFYSLGLWGKVLLTHPDLAKYCNEELLLQSNPVDYLYSHPAEINGDSLKRLKPPQLAKLLTLRPEAWHVVDQGKLSSSHWLEILKAQPKHVKECSLEDLADSDYGELIRIHPEWYRPECHGKMARLPNDFWAKSGLFVHPLFRHERRWQDLDAWQWRLVFGLEGSGSTLNAKTGDMNSLKELASGDFLEVGDYRWIYDFSKEILRCSAMYSKGKPTQFERDLNTCLVRKNFTALEYLLQLNRDLVLSQFDYRRKVLALCVYAPYPLVCQILPKIDPEYVCEEDLSGNTALHYTFLRDPIGDDPETNSIRALLKTMGVKDKANDNGLKLADLFRFLRRQVKD